MKADFNPSLPRRPKAKVGTLWIILASLLLHLVIVILIARSPNEIPNFETANDAAPKTKPIAARLIFTPISQPKEPVPADKPEPANDVNLVTTSEPAPTPDATAKRAPPPTVESEPVAVAPPEPIALPESVPELPPDEVSQSEAKSEASFMQHDPLALPESSKRPHIAEGQEQTVADKVKDQLHTSSQRSIAELAAEEAARYRQEQTSPSLLDKPELSQLTEDEKLQKANEVLADCSSYTNKGIAILAGLTGGNIKCTTTNGAESFIQDRLNKTAHLPAMKDNKDK